MTEEKAILDALADLIAGRVVEKLQARELPRLLTMNEAAAYLKRSVRWLHNEMGAGRLKAIREGNSRPRFERSELDRWIEHQNGHGG
ncbi:MAG TPA: helix-turn-helix domain-containing protein [Bryobacteraceae bacterium]|nr:helix-turn-helix domain-containing protein [Bryobacteraceae bacterium]